MVYAIAFLVFARFLHMGSVLSSAFAYLAAIPVSFLGQKYFTFASRVPVGRELPTFLLVQGASLCVSVLVTYVAVDVLGMTEVVGVLAVVVIAGLSYVVMRSAVFGGSQLDAGIGSKSDTP